MQEWYVMNPQPTLNSGFEQSEWDDYVIDSFDEALTETPLGTKVYFCKGQYNDDTGLFETEFETQAIIQNRTFDAYTQGWKRQILSRISDNLADYKYVKALDTLGNWQIYLIMTMPETNSIYTKSVLHECNYNLKWQDSKTGVVYTYPTYTQDATQYNTGVEYQRTVLQTGYIQLMSWLSLDEITAEMQRDKRMFIDYAKENPEVYVVTSTSKVPYSYNEMRIMRITFTEDEYNPDTDRKDLMICDYIDSETIPQPTVPTLITYSGKPEIRIGGRKTFTAETEGNVTFSIVTSTINRNKVAYTQTENKCTVKCANDSSLVGTDFKICAERNGTVSELTVHIMGAV